MNKLKTSWNLSLLFKSDDDPAIKNKRKQTQKETDKFVKKWKNRNDYLTNPKILKIALDEYEEWLRFFGANIHEQYYFHLRTSLEQNNPNLKAYDNKAVELSKKLENEIQFFTLRIARIDPKLQNKFLSYQPLQPYKHFLEKLFIQSKYQLSEAEEKIMNLKSTTSHDNWIKMTQAFLAKETAKVLDENGRKSVKNFSEILGLMNSKKKKVRDKAAEAFNIILEKHIYVAEHEINSVFQNKRINDELRGYDRPDKERHVADDVGTEIVDTLVKTVSDHFNIPQRYYKLKAKLMKVPKLKYYERNVEFGKIDKKYEFNKAIDLISKVFLYLDPEFHEIFRNFVQNGQVDVFPKKNKSTGAFCTHGLIINPIYILLNWTNKINDVLTFAHELGHGINDELIKKSQNSLNFGTSTFTAEVASTFMEDFVLEEMMREADDKLRLALLMMKLNEDINTIFRQIAFYNFELELHRKLKEKGYLSNVEIGRIFQKHMKSYMGEYVEQSVGSQNWWVYVGHFRYFFYVYSYAGGLLISKSLQASVKKDPEFIQKIKEFLSAGLSDSPKNIFAKLGIDIADKSFWEKGIGEVDISITNAEILAKKYNRG